jgi:hypothetical protein
MSRLRKAFALAFMAGTVAVATTTAASASTLAASAPGASTAGTSTAGTSTAGTRHSERLFYATALTAHPGKGKGGKGKVSPDIGVVGCSDTAVMIYQKNGSDVCYAYDGTTPYLQIDAYDLWPGNNYGAVLDNYADQNASTCFGQWPAGEGCVNSDGTQCNACGSIDWAYSPYWYAIINYISIKGWGA